MEIISNIFGSISAILLIFSILSFVASFFSPTSRVNYNERYDWIVFLIYGIILAGSAIFFGLLYLVVSHL